MLSNAKGIRFKPILLQSCFTHQVPLHFSLMYSNVEENLNWYASLPTRLILDTTFWALISLFLLLNVIVAKFLAELKVFYCTLCACVRARFMTTPTKLNFRIRWLRSVVSRSISSQPWTLEWCARCVKIHSVETRTSSTRVDKCGTKDVLCKLVRWSVANWHTSQLWWTKIMY